MSDDDKNDTKTDGQGRSPLTLKPRLGGNVSTGTVKQSFSHGRSKTVVVETKRSIRAPGQGAPQGTNPAAGSARPGPQTNLAQTNLAKPNPAAAQPPRPAQGPRPAGQPTGGLSNEELDARRRAIELARAESERRSREAPAPVPTFSPVAEAKPVVTEAPAAPVAQVPAPEAPVAQAVSTSIPSPQTPPRDYSQRTEAPRPPRQDRPDNRGGDRGPPRGDHRSDQQRGDGRPPFRSDRPGGDRNNDRQNDRPGGNRDGGHREGGRSERDPRSGGYGVAGQGRDRSGAPQGGRDQGPRGERPAGGGAPARQGETVRYSANSPRPAGPRGPGGGRGPALSNVPPATPEVDRIRSTRGAAGVPGKALDARKVIDDEEAKGKRGKAGAPTKAVSQTRGEPKRREGRLTIQAVVGDDEDAAERMRSLASVRRAREREREKRKGAQVEQARVARDVVIPDVITVQELSNRMAVRAVDIIKLLMKQGMMLKINDVIDTDTAELVATEFGHTVKRVSESDVEEGFIDAEDHDDDTQPRPPVVAVMGHVDHGKTSLLDALRKTDTTSGEAGGITQHIGAYQVRVASGERVTFLDTPGHAAFSAMRARGANVTDIVVLVVAADDGVMPQTIEAINHARAAKTPMIVAINKIDKPDAKPQNIINELLQHEVVVESLGGDTQVVEVSAKTGKGLDNLIEAILLQSEVLELRANPDRTAEGVVIEAKLDKGRGPVATVLVKRGTLKRGDIIVAGSSWGRVRALINERDEQLPQAGPSEPVEILGLDEAPDPGEAFAVVESEARAREITDYRDRLRRDKMVAPVGAVSLTDMMSKLATKKVKELQLIIKADVQGSAEAIISSLEKIGNEEVRARIIHSGAGAITESDVQLAKGSNAPIIGFNVRAGKQARDLAEREGVEIRYYSIIYDLLDDIKGVLSGMLAPIQRETFLGNAEVLEVFDISKVGKVAGCIVSEGKVQKGARVRILRDNVVIQEMGVLTTLKRFKDEVNEVQVSQECGMSFGQFQDIKKGDFIECFTVDEIKRSL